MRWQHILSISLLFISFLGDAHAELFAIHLQSWPTPQKTSIGKACAKVHTEVFRSMLSGSRVNSRGQYESVLENWSSEGRDRQWKQIPDNILSDWQNVHQYTTPEKIETLRQMDRSLSPMRTEYVHFEAANDRVGLRIFDGSMVIENAGIPWVAASRSDSRLPIERIDSNLMLPERSDPHARVIELGLLDVTNNVSQGMRWAFGKAAAYVDKTHNRMEFMGFGRVTTARTRKVKIYAQTRKEQVALFERFGLVPVKDAQGQDVVLSSGLILLSADGATFIEKSFYHQTIPNLKDAPRETLSPEQMRSQMRAHHEFMSRAESNRLQFTSKSELQDVRAAMLRLLDSARTFHPKSPEHNERLTLFLFTYLKVLHSMPESWRSPNYESVRMTLFQAAAQADPHAAYIYLWMTIRPEAQNQMIGPDFEAQFFRNMPNIPIHFGEN